MLKIRKKDSEEMCNIVQGICNMKNTVKLFNNSLSENLTLASENSLFYE
jgi:ABC-type transport system involved in cytochrome bd biosynthesis fused ATPase/permease subunit